MNPLLKLCLRLRWFIIVHNLTCTSTAFLLAPGKQTRVGATRFCSSSDETSATIRSGVECRSGADPLRPQKVNQDAYFQTSFSATINGNTDDFTCVGVFDGHGLKGHVLTEYLARQLPHNIQEQLKSQPRIMHEDFEEQVERLAGIPKRKGLVVDRSTSSDSQDHQIIHEALINSFHASHVDATKDPSVPAGRNGSTCIVCLFNNHKNDIHVAHVGDSRAILVSVNNDDIAAASIQQLTVETTVKIDSENERVQQCEGTVRGRNVFYGPMGISMTRALGDAVMLRAGVVPTPVVKTYSKNKNDEQHYIILATDGVWDVLSNEDVASIVIDSCATDGNNNVQSAARNVADQAKSKWIGDLPLMEEKVDDITCFILEY